jgi:hypothetical protein
MMPHQVCKECGYYKGRKILRTKTDRMYARGQAREAQASKMRTHHQETEGAGTENTVQEKK